MLLAMVDNAFAEARAMTGAMHPDECDEERERLDFERRVVRAVIEGRVGVMRPARTKRP